MSFGWMRRGTVLVAVSASLAVLAIGGAGASNARVAGADGCGSAGLTGPPGTGGPASSGTLRACWSTYGSFGEGQVSFGGSIIRDELPDGRRSELWARVVTSSGTRSILLAEALTAGSSNSPPATVSVPTVGAVRVEGAACTSNAGSSRSCGSWKVAFQS